MDYFRILNLEREPFSNSPEPGLFCPSRNHVECLQMLEMAIRLRRGLNVVLGDVGTGKTTLCRKLIQQFTAAEDRDRVEVHLVLDPSFSTAEEFLSALAGFFGIPSPETSTNERQLKEAIKTRLFTKGVDGGKIVVLLVDEGQKLPDFCLEILRELLNYETNDSKLLQIVIFAQTEFDQAIRRRANFSDRINLYYRLNPLSFMETGRMIRYRIAQSGGQEKMQFLFTWPAIYAVYRATGGYPRAINMLCHHLVMAMIIQNRSRVGVSLVRAGAERLTLFHTSRWRMKMALAVAVLAISLTVLAVSFNKASQTGAAIEVAATKTGALPIAAEKTGTPEPSIQSRELPSALGQVPVKKGKNVSLVFFDIYASADADLLGAFVRANPQIEDINMVAADAIINIPAIPARAENVLKKSCYIQIARSANLGEAHKLFSTRFGENTAGVMLFPYWNNREGLVFALLLKDRFPNRSLAEEAVKKLPSTLREGARVIEQWDEDTVFYRRLGDET